MSSQYENLSDLATFAECFKVQPAVLPAERWVRARRSSGFVRAVAQAPVVAAAQGDADADADALQPSADVAVTMSTPAKSAALVVREWVPAQWGLVPHWVKSASDARLRAPKLIEARSETASTTMAFRDAWLAGQRCIVPMQAFFEDDLRSGGKPVPTRIARVDGAPMGAAGLWAQWTDPATGEVVISYALLTINANSHALMHRYQHPGSEKRMLAILGEGTYDAWLTARPEKAREFMRPYPANWLTANPVERKQDKKPKGWLD